MINFSINGVDCDNSTKDGDGMTIFIMGFRHIVDEPYACTVEAILPGDDYANASAYALTPDGTRCGDVYDAPIRVQVLHEYVLVGKDTSMLRNSIQFSTLG